MIKKDSPEKNIIPFKQFGFTPAGEAGDNIFGNCPLCGKPRKFFLDPNTKKWDCKVCMAQGGFKVFMEAMVEKCQKAFQGRPAMDLSSNRNLSVRVMKKLGLGYNVINDTYILPVYAQDGKTLHDVRVYDKKKLMSISGFQVGLYGWQDIMPAKEVWLCEGEWDRMAMIIMLSESKYHEKDCTLSVPGAGTFKQEWVPLFKDKIVHVMYDHDEPGKKGACKVHQMLKDIVREIDFVNWPEDKDDGYDTRDFKVETDGKEVERIELIKKLLQKTPPEPKEKLVKHTEQTEELEKYDGPYVDPKDVLAGYSKWLYLPNPDVLDVMFGTLIANRLDGDPLWLFLMAPPGGTKTELLNTISAGPNIYSTSSITARALVSGGVMAGGGDPSLIPKLDQKVLVVKDFTVVLNAPQMARDEVFGILRDAYDGKTEKDFGNGLHRTYTVKFGFISGVTPAYEQYTEGNTSLGERFLIYKIKIPDSAIEREKYLERAAKNAGRETQMREELAAIGRAVLKHDFKVVPQVPTAMEKKVRALAQYTSKMRGTVTRDRFTKEITHGAYSEIGTRLVKQYTKMLFGLGMYNGLKTVDNRSYGIVKHMALSTVPQRLEQCVHYMYDEDCDNYYLTSDLADMLQLPSLTTERQLENLKQLGMLEAKKSNLGKMQWKLSEDCVYLIEEAGLYV